MPRSRYARWGLIALFLMLAGTAQADPLPSINLRGVAPPPGPKGTLYMESVNSPGHLQFNTASWISWAYRPLVVRRGDEIAAAIVRHQVVMDVAGAVGLGKRFELGLALPVVLFQSGDTGVETGVVLQGSKVPSQALGDAVIAAKATLRPVDEEFGGLGFALVGRLGLPSGSRASTLGEGTVTSEVRGLAELRIVAASLQATVGFKVRAEERNFVGKNWGNEIPWGVGFLIKPQMLGWDKSGRWYVGIESHGMLPAGPDAPFTSKAQAPVFLAGTARYQIRDLQLLTGLEGGISQGAGAAPVRVIFGVNWAPRNHDVDGDGIEDEFDDCKNKPEDHDGFEDKDGCPDPDNDDDDVLDEDDKCPLEPEDPDDFEDEDGCPDPDNDRDGILDEEDACPNEAGPHSDHSEKNGCPIVDPDNDGIEGDDDLCPDQPEDKDGFEDEDGCPDPDNDEDGIADAEDACPNEKGEPSSLPGENGCPSPDRDRDGIPNELDQCPDEPENYNGFEDEDGCPDTPKGKPRVLVEIVERRGKREFVFTAPLRFKKGTTDWEPRSLAVARALAQQIANSSGLSVSVAVRPSPTDGGEELAKRRAETLVALLRSSSRQANSANKITWIKGKMTQNAERIGIALEIVEEKL